MAIRIRTEARHEQPAADSLRGLRRRLAVRAAESDIWDAVQLARHDGARTRSTTSAACSATSGAARRPRRRRRGHRGRVGAYAAAVAVIGQQKGRDTQDRAYRNFGMPSPEGYAKAPRVGPRREARLPARDPHRHAGRVPGGGAEQRGQAARSRAHPGDVAPAGALGGRVHRRRLLRRRPGAGVADRVLMLEHATYSVISPEGGAAILWRDSTSQVAAAAFRPTAAQRYRWGRRRGRARAGGRRPPGSRPRSAPARRRDRAGARLDRGRAGRAAPRERGAPSSGAWACGSRTASWWASGSPTRSLHRLSERPARAGPAAVISRWSASPAAPRRSPAWADRCAARRSACGRRHRAR